MPLWVCAEGQLGGNDWGVHEETLYERLSQGFFFLYQHTCYFKTDQHAPQALTHTCSSLSCCFPQRHLSFTRGNDVPWLWVVLRQFPAGCYQKKHNKGNTSRSGVVCLPHKLHRWTRCHKTRTWPCAWGSRVAGGRASRGASAWRSNDWGRVSHWRRRWRSGPEGDTMRERERERCVIRLKHTVTRWLLIQAENNERWGEGGGSRSELDIIKKNGGRGEGKERKKAFLLTCSCFICPVQRQPSSLWMQRMGRARICCSSSGSG